LARFPLSRPSFITPRNIDKNLARPFSHSRVMSRVCGTRYQFSRVRRQAARWRNSVSLNCSSLPTGRSG
jgi:hypothetical protein